jgi:NADH:ubiquinone oxidoreductase subunit F (NADH-binding)
MMVIKHWKSACEMKPEDVIATLKNSGLRGRGGADSPPVEMEFCSRRQER